MAEPETVSRDLLTEFRRREAARVEAALDELLPAAETSPEELHRAMRHSLFAGGKRLRPLLVIAAARALGTPPEPVLPAACAVELVHTYSLIHDDLPAFDDEELRRGEPTSHVLFGDAVAILAGDALQALAFGVLADAATAADDPRPWSRAAGIVARAAGSAGMCGGQALDIRAAGEIIDLEALRSLHAAKTGALLTASAVAGAVLGGADREQQEAIVEYGNSVGLAFQIVDDLLDVEGSAEELGKRPGGDADRGQPTFPALIGVDAARQEAGRHRERAIASVGRFGEDADVLRALADFIVDRTR